AEQLRQLLGGYKPSSLALAASRLDKGSLRSWLESKRKDCVSELLSSELRTPRPLGLKESVQLRTARLVLDVRTAMEENDLVGLREALEDDKALFPPYFLAPVVRPEIATNAKIVAILEKIGAALDNPTMQELNRQVEVDKKEPRTVAAAFLKAKGLVN
ncbi:MAG: glycine betaine ABC transporter substrate-binding protein, partial [Hyphomicrobiales bacterium]